MLLPAGGLHQFFEAGTTVAPEQINQQGLAGAEADGVPGGVNAWRDVVTMVGAEARTGASIARACLCVFSARIGADSSIRGGAGIVHRFPLIGVRQ
ncbi:MAG: hypothetical protein TEF_03320 [Rhizobiales bacterium NRL2]|nr:MAG: hypothetical protein TEF_03320 [Rhizobiales bacterium NRL2]